MSLYFSPANQKLRKLYTVPALQKYLPKGKKVYSLDLSSGVSCPGALECKSQVVMDIDGRPRIEDGPACVFRCFSASQEVLFPVVRENRKKNFEKIKRAKSVTKIRDLILKSIPANAGVVRYHVAGDFFNINYLLAAIEVAIMRPAVLFYSYTKSLHILSKLQLAHLNSPALSRGVLTPNFLLTASEGGLYDGYVSILGMRTAKVVLSESEAGNLPIDIDDSHAATPGGSFALPIHGPQKAGSEASKAWTQLKLSKKEN